MDSARILIIEDDVTLNDQLADLLRGRGFNITQCRDGEQGLMAAIKDKFELILLDVLLPTMDGFSVLKNLRKSRQTPVMMLTACGAEEDRIRGYSSGADDYLPKPFNFTELGLRIDALLRRSFGLGDRRNQSTEILVDGLRLNRLRQTVSFDGQPITLTPIQFKLLWVLVDSQNDVLTKPYLYQLVLEREFSKYDRSLDMHLSRVRRKLVDAGMAADRLSTVHGKGYCFA
ncbi:response regulator transcription factor [Alkalimarinus coralli]|uniref:response regulator transcription factor n=1 Tax=Alkalimarinus coralli TaxID=2935863 RepID=UPI00202AEF1B|nr:response regulator transcription factor [Alkalimarinus coralli]